METEGRESEFGGMTVNERLFAAGLLAQRDEAAGRRDRGAMIAMLRRVHLPEPMAAWSVDQMLGKTT